MLPSAPPLNARNEKGKKTHSKIMIHWRRKKGKPTPHKTPHNRIRRNCRICVHQVHINQIRDNLQKHNLDPGSNRNPRQDLRPGIDARIRGPGKPEEAYWESEAAEDERIEAVFGGDVAALLEIAFDGCVSVVGNVSRAQNNADTDRDEGESADAFVVSSFFDEAYWVGLDIPVSRRQSRRSCYSRLTSKSR